MNGFVAFQIPLNKQLPLPVNVDMPWGMVANPKYEYEIATPDSSHILYATLKGNDCQINLMQENSSVLADREASLHLYSHQGWSLCISCNVLPIPERRKAVAR